MAIGMRPRLGQNLQNIVAGDEPWPMPQTPFPVPSPVPGMGAAPVKPRSKGQMIAGIVGDTLLGLAGQSGVYGPMVARERQQAQADQREEAQWSRRRDIQNADQRANRQWEIDHRAPSEFERIAAAAGILPGSPGFATAAQKRLDNMLNPMMPVATTDADGNPAYTYLPRNGGSTAPAASGPPAAAVDHLRQNPSLKSAFDAKYGQGAADRVLGGGVGNGTGGFRP